MEFKGEDEQTYMLHVKEIECNRTIEQANVTDSGLFCPTIWDGILCWNQTEAGTLAAQPCPAYIIGFREQFLSTKWCTPEGKWFFNKAQNNLWTNFTLCYEASTTTVFSNFSESSGNYSYITDYLPIMKSISQIGYSVSLVTLIIAFLILAAVKKLRCPRNTLHMHLFVSFILRAFMALLKDGLFVQGVGLPSDVLHKDGGSYFLDPIEPNWECKIVTSLWQFFIMANYSWILMEGLYLHNLIFLALFSDTSAITLYVLLGWGLPFIFVSPWVAMRILLEDTFCWTTNRNPYLFLIIRIPTSAFILINFALFVNIVRVLLLKLKASVCKETNTYRRWAKSTLVLVPLFGVHYTLFLGMSYSIGVDPTVELIWLFCDQLFASFQGFFVAVLYCFMNGEVLAELGKKWNRIQCQRDGQPDSFVSGRKRRSWANSVSWLSLGVPHWPGAKARANKRTASSMQYTDHSQVSCCSNLVEGGVAVEQIVPGSLEMRYIRPH